MSTKKDTSTAQTAGTAKGSSSASNRDVFINNIHPKERIVNRSAKNFRAIWHKKRFCQGEPIRDTFDAAESFKDPAKANSKETPQKQRNLQRSRQGELKRDTFDRAESFMETFISNTIIHQKEGAVNHKSQKNKRFSLPETDSTGETLSAEQREFFKDSKAAGGGWALSGAVRPPQRRDV